MRRHACALSTQFTSFLLLLLVLITLPWLHVSRHFRSIQFATKIKLWKTGYTILKKKNLSFSCVAPKPSMRKGKMNWIFTFPLCHDLRPNHKWKKKKSLSNRIAYHDCRPMVLWKNFTGQNEFSSEFYAAHWHISFISCAYVNVIILRISQFATYQRPHTENIWFGHWTHAVGISNVHSSEWFSLAPVVRIFLKQLITFVLFFLFSFISIQFEHKTCV